MQKALERRIRAELRVYDRARFGKRAALAALLFFLSIVAVELVGVFYAAVAAN